jgi:hypothetical protein
MGVVAASAGE